MQIVYISRRPAVLSGTLLQVKRFMPFVDEAVVVCPSVMALEMKSRISGIRLTILTDEELLGPDNSVMVDHQARNLGLRSRLVASGVTGPRFIMSDDDSRPMCPIERSVFVDNDRFHNYYFYDLGLWPGKRTEFDRGQHNTAELLTRRGFPRLSYASHMPQILDRAIFIAMLDEFSDSVVSGSYCEWSLYFNYAVSQYPGRFHEPRPYLTFCWPDAPYTWPLYVEPEEYCFENYYPEYYQSGRTFEGLDDTPAPAQLADVNLEKLARWKIIAQDRLAGRMSRADPWVRSSRWRWFVTRLGGPLFRRRYSLNSSVSKTGPAQP